MIVDQRRNAKRVTLAHIFIPLYYTPTAPLPNQPPVGNVVSVNAAQPGTASVLDKASMMPVIRARFRAPNGRVCEGNILIDSGADTTVIKDEDERLYLMRVTYDSILVILIT